MISKKAPYYASWIVPALLGGLVFLWNCRFSFGPTFLRDEIGYLTKAEALSGHIVEGASSYHGGLAFFVAPLFLIFDDPLIIWRGVIFVNAIFVMGIVWLTYRLADHLVPETAQLRAKALIFCLAQPGIWVMSSYLFPTVYLCFFFLLSCYFALKWDLTSVGGSALLAAITGFSYWLHPMGLALSVASIISYFACHVARNARPNWVGLITHILVLILFVVGYAVFLQDAWNRSMSPAGEGAWNHYPTASSMQFRLMSFNGVTSVLRAAFGQAAYFFLATFGLGVIGCAVVFERVRQYCLAGGSQKQYFLMMFLLMSLMALWGLGALAMIGVEGEVFRLDHLVYGRYHEFSYIPFMLIGFARVYELSWCSRLKWLLPFLCVVLVSVYLISMLQQVAPVNLVNVVGFFPIYSFGRDALFGPKFQLIVGLAGGFAMVSLFWLFLRKMLPIAMLVFGLVAVYQQSSWHSQALMTYSFPPKIYSDVVRVYPVGSCVGIDLPVSEVRKLVEFRQKNTFQYERFKILEFYLYNFRYGSMKFEDWRSGCSGPFLTFWPERYNTEGLYLVNDPSGLVLVSKTAMPESCMPPKCMEAKRFGFPAPIWMQVGELEGGAIRSRGKDGLLTYGPYQSLESGRYVVDLYGRSRDLRGVWVDLVSGRGAVRHGRWNLSETSALGLEGNHLMHQEVDVNELGLDFELRVFVSKDSDISIESYIVRKID